MKVSGTVQATGQAGTPVTDGAVPVTDAGVFSDVLAWFGRDDRSPPASSGPARPQLVASTPSQGKASTSEVAAAATAPAHGLVSAAMLAAGGRPTDFATGRAVAPAARDPMTFGPSLSATQPAMVGTAPARVDATTAIRAEAGLGGAIDASATMLVATASPPSMNAAVPSAASGCLDATGEILAGTGARTATVSSTASARSPVGASRPAPTGELPVQSGRSAPPTSTSPPAKVDASTSTLPATSTPAGLPASAATLAAGTPSGQATEATPPAPAPSAHPTRSGKPSMPTLVAAAAKGALSGSIAGNDPAAMSDATGAKRGNDGTAGTVLQAAPPDEAKGNAPSGTEVDQTDPNSVVANSAASPDIAATAVVMSMAFPAPLLGMAAQGNPTGTQRTDTIRSAPNVSVATLGTSVPVAAAQPGAQGQASPAAAARDGVEEPPTTMVVADLRVASHLAPATRATSGVGAESGAPVRSEADLPQAAQAAGPDAAGSFAAASAAEMGVASSQMASASVHTIASSVVDLARATADAAAKSTLIAAGAPPVAPARTMTLQLAPAELGTVAVRLHLTGHNLDVQLSFSDSTTLSLVSHERDALAGALDGNGYHVASLVLQNTASPQNTTQPATHASGDQGASMQASGGGADSQASGGGRMSRGGGGNGSDQPPAGARPQPRDPAAGLRDDRASGVFV